MIKSFIPICTILLLLGSCASTNSPGHIKPVRRLGTGEFNMGGNFSGGSNIFDKQLYLRTGIFRYLDIGFNINPLTGAGLNTLAHFNNETDKIPEIALGYESFKWEFTKDYAFTNEVLLREDTARYTLTGQTSMISLLLIKSINDNRLVYFGARKSDTVTKNKMSVSNTSAFLGTEVASTANTALILEAGSNMAYTVNNEGSAYPHFTAEELVKELPNGVYLGVSAAYFFGINHSTASNKISNYPGNKPKFKETGISTSTAKSNVINEKSKIKNENTQTKKKPLKTKSKPTDVKNKTKSEDKKSALKEMKPSESSPEEIKNKIDDKKSEKQRKKEEKERKKAEKKKKKAEEKLKKTEERLKKEKTAKEDQ